MRRIGLVVGAVLTSIAVMKSQDRATVYGQGTRTCQQWTKDRARPVLHSRDLAWVMGFASGADVAGGPLRTTQEEALEIWIDADCSDHPRELLAAAATRLVASLRE